MVLLVLVLTAGALVGRLRRPAGGHGARPHPHHLWAAGAGALLVAGSLVVPDGGAVLVRACGLVFLAAFAGVNLQVTGIAVAGLGVLLNLAGLVLNDGIPVDADALERADVAEASDEPYHLQTDGGAFDWLGAVVPLRATGQVLSFGDLIVLTGLFDVVRERARRRARPPAVFDDQVEPAITQASVDHDWGTAPRGAPESGSQSSANPDRIAAEHDDFWREAQLARSPFRFAASHDR